MRYVLQIRLRVCRMVVNAICILQSFGCALRFETETRFDDCLVRELWRLAVELWQNARKQKNPDSLQGIGILGVTSGIRTHDIQNHNLTL